MSSPSKNHTRESSSLSEKSLHFLESSHSKKHQKNPKTIDSAKPKKLTKSAKNIDSAKIDFADFVDFVEVGKIGRVSGLKGRLCFWLSGDFEEFLSRGLEVQVRLANELESLKSKIKSPKFAKDFGNIPLSVSATENLTPALPAYTTLTISSFIKKVDRYFIEFEGITSADSAKRLVNAKIYATKAQSREHCKLKKDEYFYFDIIGLDIIEEGENLGIVRDIERIGNIDYFIVEVADSIASNIATKSAQLQNHKPNNIAKSTNAANFINSAQSAKKSKKPKTFLVPYIDRFVLEVCLQTRRIFTKNAKDILDQS